MIPSQPNKNRKVYIRLKYIQFRFGKAISHISERLINRIASCMLCMARCSARRGLCNDCLANLPTLGVACQKCREPMDSVDDIALDNNLLCPRCQKGKRHFHICVAALQYVPPVSNMLQKLKYSSRLLYLKPLSLHLLHELERHYADKPWPEALLPVPMHWWKMQKRGFNQAQLIARRLGKETGIPLLCHHAQKLHTTTPQSRLNAKTRLRNIRHSYRIKRRITQQHIAIVDDVMTTGSTVDELCRTLKEHGVQTIDVWCIARTPNKRQRKSTY